MPEEKRSKRFDTRSLVLMAVLTAIEIVLSRFLSISAWDMKIGFSFLPIVVAAVALGPWQAAAVAALGDFAGALLFPIGPYFPGFTLTAFLTGLTFGYLLHRNRTTLRVLVAVGINQFILSLLLNTLWISILYGSPFSVLMATRIVQTLVLFPIQIIFTLLICKVMDRIPFDRAAA